MKINIRYKGNINNTSVIIFLIQSQLNKTPSDGNCLGEPPGGFCDVGCCCFLPHWRIFISLLFDVILHPSESYRRVFTLILYFQPSSSQSDSWHFHFDFSKLFIFTASAPVLSGLFYRRRFLLYITLLVTQMLLGTPHPWSSSVPVLTELSLPADAWTWTIDVWITRPLMYQLRQWATKYRVKIELLNLFRLFKVICKDYWKTLWTILVTAYNRFHERYFKKAATRKEAKLHIK